MSKSIIFAIIVILSLSLLVSCSGGNGGVTAPDNGGNNEAAVVPGTGTAVAGLWQMVADKATGSIDIVQLRSADKMLNVIGFMEPPPLTLMDLDWPSLVIDFDAGTIDVGVKLTHPLGSDPNATFTGFDVRGVCFGPAVTNADGLTKAMSPEFFSGEVFGYQDGLLGVPDSTGNYSGWAGYKYFCDGLSTNDDLATFLGSESNLANRGKFTGTTPHERMYNLAWANPADVLIFNYAIYANYDWPVGDPPFTLDAFPITTSNSAEAILATTNVSDNTLYYVDDATRGGTASFQVEVWDWLGDISGVSIESVTPGVIAATEPDGPATPGSTSKSWIYDFSAVAATPITNADLDIMVTVTDAKTYGEAWFLDLLSPGNSMHDTQIAVAWTASVPVSSEIPYAVTASSNFYTCYYNGTVILSAESDPPGGAITWDLDEDGVFDDASGSPYTWAGLGVGAHTAVARATDGPMVADSDPVVINVCSAYPTNWTSSTDDPDILDWNDIHTTGTFVLSGDDGYTYIWGPFNFMFGGTQMTTNTVITLSCNGAIAFSNAYTYYFIAYGQCISAGNYWYNSYNYAACPSWDDGYIMGGVYWQVLGTAPERKLVIQWYNQNQYACYNGNDLNYEIIIYEGSNNISMQYNDMTGTCSNGAGASSTVGILFNTPYGSQITAANSRQYSCNSGTLSDNFALTFQGCP